jgi:hypothetical protein
VLRGRDIVENDAEVLLVSRDAAKLYWGTDDPIGRRAALPSVSKTVLRQVVGIVGDVKQRNLVEPSTPTVYFYTREPYGKATFVIRTSVPPATLAQPAVAAIGAIDPGQPVGDIQTMEQVRLSRRAILRRADRRAGHAALARVLSRGPCGDG